MKKLAKEYRQSLQKRKAKRALLKVKAILDAQDRRMESRLFRKKKNMGIK